MSICFTAWLLNSLFEDRYDEKWMGIVALSAMASFSCAAQWQVMDQDSRVSFISVKKGDIGEVHHFKQLKGTLKMMVNSD